MFGHATYLTFELCWGLPVLAIQWAAGSRRLLEHAAVLVTTLTLLTLYLSVADGVAIHEGIWTIHMARITGVRVWGVPIEESLFFLLTDAMVIQTVILLWAGTRPWNWMRRERK